MSNSMAWKYVETGYYGRAIDSVVECLSVAEKVIEERSDAFNLWKTVGDACMLFSWVQNLAHLFQSSVNPVFGSTQIVPSDGMGMPVIGARKDSPLVGENSHVHGRRDIVELSRLDLSQCLLANQVNISHYVKLTGLKVTLYKSQDLVTRTIKLEPGNHEFWNALGLATAELNPKVAQHSLVRALYINDKVGNPFCIGFIDH